MRVPPRPPRGGEGGPYAKSFNFFLKLTIFLARAGPPLPPGRARTRPRKNVNLKKKLKTKASPE